MYGLYLEDLESKFRCADSFRVMSRLAVDSSRQLLIECVAEEISAVVKRKLADRIALRVGFEILF